MTLLFQRGDGHVAPVLQRKHIDGPLVTFSDGQMHWLTWPERIQLMLGRVDAWGLQTKLRPDLNYVQRRDR